ncbi:recombination mediator RecR [Synechocystis salina]|uniref:recombination mediator RecR n=1 Tax=Synechocystis salina TaxID=945780 RepID=UPI0039080360
MSKISLAPGGLGAIYTPPLARLIEQLQRLPSVGPKTAQRLALHLLKRPDAEVENLAQAILDAKKRVGQCQVCFHLSAEPVCDICRHPQRDNSVICVVSDPRDVIALEKTREFRGKYHVLGGVISPMDGIGPEQLTIQPLLHRVSRPEIAEVILAISPSVEGETTTLYLGKLLQPFTKVTRIAFGLPMGGDLEYADEVTLARALEGRREL